MLTQNQLNEIKQLQQICEKEDNIGLKLNWDMLQIRDEEINDFFHYEENELVGFLAIYGFGKKVEVCGMVSPTHRKKGIFTNLLSLALLICEEREYTEILLNSPSTSTSAKELLQKIPCKLVFSEYQMMWSEVKLALDDNVLVRLATPEDLKAEIQIDVLSFGFQEEQAIEYNNQVKLDSTQQFCIIEHNEKTVGKLRVSRLEDEAWIYGFAVLPAHQGKGIGRRALQKIIKQEHEAGFKIFLEVEAKNIHALKLYESCGFKVFQAQDYYQYTIK
ncbi:GNAT family N-acetyltransferase [Metabacillus herbersteinensis]|uniref:GNAT family N-acetyltransferase n=1 Tax=Metabacillus herbersteinensis TaxID=283816 RepID=A0ABV6GLF0_9BACI